jgi:hypothetical protein
MFFAIVGSVAGEGAVGARQKLEVKSSWTMGWCKASNGKVQKCRKALHSWGDDEAGRLTLEDDFAPGLTCSEVLTGLPAVGELRGRLARLY